MSCKITQSYCWYNNATMLVKMYFIQGIPFAFDEVQEELQTNKEIIREADKNKLYDPDELYLKSLYLVDEECHPLLFPIDIENPQDMPDESFLHFDEDDFDS